MVALDAVLFMRKKVIRLDEMDLNLPLAVTDTKHYAVKVAYDSQIKTVTELGPGPTSEDLFVHLNQEALRWQVWDYTHSKFRMGVGVQSTYLEKLDDGIFFRYYDVTGLSWPSWLLIAGLEAS